MIKKLYEGLDFMPALVELSQSKAWGTIPFRTSYEGSAHKEVEDIVLRYPILEEPEDAFDAISCIPYDPWYDLPEIRKIVFDTMRAFEGVQLGKVVVTNLPAGGKIRPHIDEGVANEVYTRLQLNLFGECEFTVGEETVTMKGGELWVFDNQLEHSVVNNTDKERVALIIDILI